MNDTGFRLSAATGLHRGDRAYQQDQVRIMAHSRVRGCALAVVADGMGGKSGGRKAADQVVLTAQQLFDRYAPGVDDPARRAGTHASSDELSTTMCSTPVTSWATREARVRVNPSGSSLTTVMTLSHGRSGVIGSTSSH